MPLIIFALGLLYAALGAAIPMLRRRRISEGRLALAAAATLATSTAVLAYYVTTEDSYRRNGISRWSAYGTSGAQILFWLGMSLAAAALIAGGLSRLRTGRLRAAYAVGLAAVILQFLAVVAFTAN